jgi:hypothetical protein
MVIDELVERLQRKAQQASEISRTMAEDKSLRQSGNPERRRDLYAWTKPEDTDEAKAASLLLAMKEALVEARAALHQHYVDWDGEPEDAVPLQLARAKIDATLNQGVPGDVR